MGRPKSKILGRPKSKIRREIINTTIDKKLLELVRDMCVDIGIPMNRIIENVLRGKYENKPKK